MTKKIYFSFHYCSDIDRVNQVTDVWFSREGAEASGRWDDKEFMTYFEKKGIESVYPYIDSLRKNTALTVVLIGDKTFDSPFTKYELEKAVKEQIPVIAIHLRDLTNKKGEPSPKGRNPLDATMISKDGKDVPLSEVYPTYDWINDNGSQNLHSWVEKALES